MKEETRCNRGIELWKDELKLLFNFVFMFLCSYFLTEFGRCRWIKFRVCLHRNI